MRAGKIVVGRKQAAESRVQLENSKEVAGDILPVQPFGFVAGPKDHVLRCAHPDYHQIRPISYRCAVLTKGRVIKVIVIVRVAIAVDKSGR